MPCEQMFFFYPPIRWIRAKRQPARFLSKKAERHMFLFKASQSAMHFWLCRKCFCVTLDKSNRTKIFRTAHILTAYAVRLFHSHVLMNNVALLLMNRTIMFYLTRNRSVLQFVFLSYHLIRHNHVAEQNLKKQTKGGVRYGKNSKRHDR